MQTLVFSFDGLDQQYLERYSGVMPTISRLRRTGTTAPLDPPVPQAPISAWTTVATGTAPHEHGIFDHRTRDGYPGSERPANLADRNRPYVWEYLASQGARAVVCGLPVMSAAPPSKCRISRSDGENTTLIPGRNTRGPTTATPASRPWTTADVHSCSDLEVLLERRRRVCQDCLENEPWELAIVHVPILTPRLLARLTRADGADPETVRRRALHSADRLVEGLLDSVSETTTVIGCSPAGVRHVDGYAVHLNELLVEAGQLERTAVAKQTGIRKVLERLTAPLCNVTPSVTVSDENADAHRQHGETTAWAAYDWERSRAFCPSQTGGGIRLNVAGREPNGKITNSIYRETQQAVIDALADCVDPDGNPAFEFVCRRDHLYPGRPPRDVPDVVVSTAGTNCTISTEPNRTPFSGFRGFVRSIPGHCFLTGPAVCGTTTRRLTGADIAPMVMASLGRPVPERMTGLVPEGLFRDGEIRGTYRHVGERLGSLPERSVTGEDDFRL
ncbi:alkaline phosphatase family protein [Halobacteria archaeon AArc-curdl1]|uniref:Alkaline phosphatase family protein n=1 Tax=Natronosalvus hydrolyticus TaxID=2979988 RepID=A0AAP3E822_9EURY|nr:alkaline phosphatase family protein [Halobacteria archaeon AArc-curdl1]